MFVIYAQVRASREGDPAGWLFATDTEALEIEYETQELSECIWMVPNTENDQ